MRMLIMRSVVRVASGATMLLGAIACAPVPLVVVPPPVVVVVADRVPDDHSLDKHGAWHLPGYKSPAGVCDPCHGADLRGTAQATSCYRCHGKKWH
jgi:hypothetical protein